MVKLSDSLLLYAPLVVNASPFLVPRQASSYAPVAVQCPSDPLTRSVRHIGDISADEQNYYDSRKPMAQQALKSWFETVQKNNNVTFDLCEDLPTMALAISGGGDRAALNGAGIIQAYDDREAKKTSMSGLYQTFMYEAATSGSNEMTGALERMDWPLVTDLINDLYANTFPVPILYPNGTKAASKPIYDEIELQLEQKYAAGFRVSLIDVLGRLYGYHFIGPPNGSPDFLMSDIADQPKFKNYTVPFPIHMTVDMSKYGVGCPEEHINNTQYEMTPFEFGSWNPDVSSFSKIKYLGSKPASGNLTCVNKFDRLAFLTTCSGNTAGLDCPTQADIQKLDNLTDYRFNITQDTFKGLVPNPFFGSASAPSIKDTEYLKLADGGGAQMGISVFPLINRPFVDVIFASDNHNSTAANHTDGTVLYNTYVLAKNLGITNMPEVPNATVFAEQGLYKRNVFFGCHTPETQSIVYMPDTNYIYNSTSIYSSGTSTLSASDVQAAVANGGLVGTYNDAAEWPLCVACLIMKKTNTTLPGECQQCFDDYCIT